MQNWQGKKTQKGGERNKKSTCNMQHTTTMTHTSVRLMDSKDSSRHPEGIAVDFLPPRKSLSIPTILFIIIIKMAQSNTKQQHTHAGGHLHLRSCRKPKNILKVHRVNHPLELFCFTFIKVTPVVNNTILLTILLSGYHVCCLYLPLNMRTWSE